MSEPLYSVGTWDCLAQAYTPQAGITTGAFNITLPKLRQAVRDLIGLGYGAYRRRSPDGSYDDNDWMVLIERTDGMTHAEIMERWKHDPPPRVGKQRVTNQTAR